jgi:hypothetical protein
MSMRRRAGKRSPERFARIPHSVLESEAVTTLHHAAFRILVILASQYWGGNNGALALTEVAARPHGFHGRDTLYRSLRELESRGLIVCTRRGMKIKNSFTLYALGWEEIHNREGKPLEKPEARNNTRWLNWKASPAAPKEKIHTDDREQSSPIVGTGQSDFIPMNASTMAISIPTIGNTLRISAGSASERATNTRASAVRDLARKVAKLVEELPGLTDNDIARMLSADVSEVRSVRRVSLSIDL